MDLAPSPEDVPAVLGFLVAFSGSAPYDHQQVQYRSATGPDRGDDCDAARDRRRHRRYDCYAVSQAAMLIES